MSPPRAAQSRSRAHCSDGVHGPRGQQARCGAEGADGPVRRWRRRPSRCGRRHRSCNQPVPLNMRPEQEGQRRAVDGARGPAAAPRLLALAGRPHYLTVSAAMWNGWHGAAEGAGTAMQKCCHVQCAATLELASGGSHKSVRRSWRPASHRARRAAQSAPGRRIPGRRIII